MNKEAARNISVLILSVAVFLACAELVSRFTEGKNARDALNRGALLKQNGNSFRRPLPPGPKGKNEIRILAMGDSYTWGDGMADDGRIWPAVLEGKLAPVFPDKDIRVLNLGLCGLTTVNEYELLLRLGLKLEPDLVIFAYIVNDILPSGPNLARVGEDWLEGSRNRKDLVPLKKAHEILAKNSYFYNFLNRRYLDFQRKFWPARSWDDLYRDGSPEWRALSKAVLGIREASLRMNFKTLAVIFPGFPEGKWNKDNIGEFPFYDIYKKVFSLMKSSAIPVFDLLPLYISQGRDFKEWRVTPLDGHPGEAAHALAAEGIADFIVRNKIVGPGT